jgi:acyl carrier protein
MNAVQTISNEQIQETIITLLQQIAPEADYDALDPQANLQEALDIDSFDFLNLLIELHKVVGVQVPESDYRQVLSLQSMVAYITARMP